MEEKLKVIYEDNHIIVVEKPYNIPAQEDSSKDIDMINIIKAYINVFLFVIFARLTKSATCLSLSNSYSDL